jgi:glycosyltransferase involved in cell wall biosynthesis
MKLLFLNRSYWPDVEATGQLLTELCTSLAKQHDVTVIAGRPNYLADGGRNRLFERQVHGGVRIIRVGNRRFSKASLLSRAVGLASYTALAAWAAFRHERPDVIVAETDPPLLGALAALLKRWHGCRFLYYLQDLYPEVGLALKKLRPGLITALLHGASQAAFHASDHVVVLGEDMRRRVLRRGVPAKKIDIVPNWVDTRTVAPLPLGRTLRAAWGLNGRFVVMYSGNLGLSQNLYEVLAAAQVLRHDPVDFVLVGDGAARAGLEERAKEWALGNVRFLPYQPKERLGESLGAADLHVLPLHRGLAGCIVPSKLYGILAAGKPYVAAVDDDSDVARVARASGSGLVVAPDSAGELVNAIRWCLHHPDELAAMGRRGRAYAQAHCDRAVAVARFERLLANLKKSTP